MNIEIEKPSRLKDLIHKIHYNIEETAFNLFMHIPDKFIPASVMAWMEQYIDKRTADLKHQIIRDRWTAVELEKVADKIRNK